MQQKDSTPKEHYLLETRKRAYSWSQSTLNVLIIYTLCLRFNDCCVGTYRKKRSRASELQVVAVKPGYVYHTVTTRSGRAVRQMIQVAIKNRSKSSTCDVTLPKIKEEHTRLTKSENVDTPTGRIYCGLCPKSYRGILQLRLHLQTDHSCTTMTTGNNTEQQNKM